MSDWMEFIEFIDGHDRVKVWVDPGAVVSMKETTERRSFSEGYRPVTELTISTGTVYKVLGHVASQVAAARGREGKK